MRVSSKSRLGTLGVTLFLVLSCFLLGRFSLQAHRDRHPLQPTLEAFVGSASKPALEELAATFEKEHGVHLNLHFGGSGRMLSELTLGGRGDLFLPGSSDYMQKAVDRDLVRCESIRPIAWLVPAINVPRGNPAGIHRLEDLLRPGVRVGMARPDSVCVGLYGREVMEEAGLWKALRPRLVTQVDSCARTAQLAAMGMVDAVLGWRVFQYWNPERIESIPIARQHVARIGTIPVAITRCSTAPSRARVFIDFLVSDRGRAILRRWHYLSSEEEARRHARPDALVSRVVLFGEGARSE